MTSKMRYLALVVAAVLAGCQSAATVKSDTANAGTNGPLFRQTPLMADIPSSQVLVFAQAACADCHAVEATDLSPNPNAPSFAAIANREGLTAQTLSAFLRDAHNYPEAMDFDLDPSQVDALTQYMLTLRDEDYEPAI